MNDSKTENLEKDQKPLYIWKIKSNRTTIICFATKARSVGSAILFLNLAAFALTDGESLEQNELNRIFKITGKLFDQSVLYDHSTLTWSPVWVPFFPVHYRDRRHIFRPWKKTWAIRWTRSRIGVPIPDSHTATQNGSKTGCLIQLWLMFKDKNILCKWTFTSSLQKHRIEVIFINNRWRPQADLSITPLWTGAAIYNQQWPCRPQQTKSGKNTSNRYGDLQKRDAGQALSNLEQFSKLSKSQRFQNLNQLIFWATKDCRKLHQNILCEREHSITRPYHPWQKCYKAVITNFRSTKINDAITLRIKRRNKLKHWANNLNANDFDQRFSQIKLKKRMRFRQTDSAHKFTVADVVEFPDCQITRILKK